MRASSGGAPRCELNRANRALFPHERSGRSFLVRIDRGAEAVAAEAPRSPAAFNASWADGLKPTLRQLNAGTSTHGVRDGRQGRVCVPRWSARAEQTGDPYIKQRLIEIVEKWRTGRPFGKRTHDKSGARGRNSPFWLEDMARHPPFSLVTPVGPSEVSPEVDELLPLAATLPRLARAAGLRRHFGNGFRNWNLTELEVETGQGGSVLKFFFDLVDDKTIFDKKGVSLPNEKRRDATPSPSRAS